MNKAQIPGLLLFLTLLTIPASTSCTTVPPGYLGLRVNMYGTQRGVDQIPIVTGRVMYNPITENIYEYPVFIQRVEYTAPGRGGDKEHRGLDESITFNSVEGATINADIAVALGFTDTQVPHIFVEFRKEADVLVRGYVHDQIRTAFNEVASKMKAMDILGDQKMQFLADVQKEAKNRLEAKGFKVDQISIISEFRLDDRVKQSINAVLQAKQAALQAEAAVAQAQAEAQQKIAQADGEAQSLLKVAEAQAKANDLLNKSLTPTLIQNKAIEKWSGTLPQVSGGAIPFINLATAGK